MEQPLQLSGGKGNTGAYTRYRIEDRSFFSIIKKEIAKEAELTGFTVDKIGKIQIVISELLSNLIKFGQRNRELLWKTVTHKGIAGIEILAIDKGPGLGSTSQAMEDGFSTSGTAGEGLGAIKRQSDFFEIYSQQGQGTVVLCRFFVKSENNIPPKEMIFHFAAFSVAKPGETFCGDGYYLEYDPGNKVFSLLVLDGLGHGQGAWEASQTGIKEYINLPKDSPGKVLHKLHLQMKKTRGAVAMALSYRFDEGLILYCGVGNITGRKISFTGIKHLSSFNGIVGHVMSSRTHDYELEWEKGSLLIVNSDGLTSRWDINRYPQVQKQDPAILAACLYRDHSRGNDDTTIIICKHPGIDGESSTTNH